MTCAICMTPVGSGEESTSCPACQARYHAECWIENAGCAVYGCHMVSDTEQLKPLEIPPAFWGREEKECPQCGIAIKAMAVRCRHCGARVEAKIEAKTAFHERQRRRAHAPWLRRVSLVFLTLSLLPVVAVIPAVFGTLFYYRNREEIRRLPGAYEGYFRISIVAGAAQTVIFFIALTAWWSMNVVLMR